MSLSLAAVHSLMRQEPPAEEFAAALIGTSFLDSLRNAGMREELEFLGGKKISGSRVYRDWQSFLEDPAFPSQTFILNERKSSEVKDKATGEKSKTIRYQQKMMISWDLAFSEHVPDISAAFYTYLISRGASIYQDALVLESDAHWLRETCSLVVSRRLVESKVKSFEQDAFFSQKARIMAMMKIQEGEFYEVVGAQLKRMASSFLIDTWEKISGEIRRGIPPEELCQMIETYITSQGTRLFAEFATGIFDALHAKQNEQVMQIAAPQSAGAIQEGNDAA